MGSSPTTGTKKRVKPLWFGSLFLCGARTREGLRNRKIVLWTVFCAEREVGYRTQSVGSTSGRVCETHGESHHRHQSRASTRKRVLRFSFLFLSLPRVGNSTCYEPPAPKRELNPCGLSLFFYVGLEQEGK